MKTIKISVLSGSILLLLSGTIAGAEPQPDHFSTLEGATLLISADELLANDGTAGLVEIVTQPSFGTLQDSEGAERIGQWTYQSFAFDDPPQPPGVDSYEGPIGQDHFSYRVSTDQGWSSTTSVTIHLAPPRVPIAGRWAVQDCEGSWGRNEALLPEMEIGWFEAETATFELCDLQLPGKEVRNAALTDCVRVPSPSMIGGDVNTLVGWLPLVGDWNNDGSDDLGIHDPAQGVTHFFSLSSPCSGLQWLETQNDGNPGDQITVGDWSGTGEDLLGLFGPCQSVGCTANDMRWWLELPGNTFRQRAPAPEASALDRVKPLTLRPFSSGADLIAYWDYESHTLSRYISDLRLGPTSVVTPHFIDLSANLELLEIPGIPFAIPGESVNLGFYLPIQDLLLTIQSDCIDDGCGGLPVQIIVDP